MIKINLEKAKAIAHDRRRISRAAEFAPLDDIIAKKIPGESAKDAEAKREAIRARYSSLQSEIDGAEDVEALAQVVKSNNL